MGVPMRAQGSNHIKHIMLWNYREETTVDERASLERALMALPDKVPSLLGVGWGPVVGGRNHSFSHCFVMLFDDMAGLDEYVVHPDHAEFSRAFKEACAVQVVVD